MKALLFINGEPPKQFPQFYNYDLVACTDGAFDYLEQFDPNILDDLDFISGDFDSHSQKVGDVFKSKYISTPDQDHPDFYKALEILVEKGVKKVDVYGASGREQDHFMGNLTVAYHFRNVLEINFFDEYSTYYFIPKHFKINGVNGKMISLFPFPKAECVSTKGLKWPLYNEDLDMLVRIGTRNIAESKEVIVDYEKGDLLIFINH